MEKAISDLIRIISEADTAKEKLVLDKLNYDLKDLEPVMSKETLEYHYKTLANSYVDRYNKGEGDPDFNKAGAFLHNIFFAQFRTAMSSNKPFGASAEFINTHFKNGYNELKEKTESVAMGIQGSGWVYLNRKGQLKTITNHQIKQDIVLLIDWWEHAWALDYQADKKQYLKNIWRIIDWSVINDRLNLK